MKLGCLSFACIAACALVACKKPDATYDFTPLPGHAGTVAAPTISTLVPTAAALSYDERAAKLKPGARCNLERVNGALFNSAPVPVQKKVPADFMGWVADVDGKTVPTSADLRVVSATGGRAWKLKLVMRRPRADVQALLGGDAAFASAGYVGEYDLSALPDDTYRLYVVFPKGDTLVVCDNGRAIALGP